MHRKGSVLGSDSELHISAKWIAGALLLTAVGLLLASDDIADPIRRTQVELLGVLIYPLCGLAWALDSWKPWLGRAFATLTLVAVIVLAGSWLAVPGALVLMTVSTAAAAAVLGLGIATLTAVGETVLLLLLARHAATDVAGAEIVVALVGIWASLGVMCAAYRPLYQFDRWLWEYLHRMRRLWDESLDRRAELAQALESLRNANRQLALANERLATLRAVAEEAQKSKADFVARVSHEFRTPLNMIIGLVGIMVENPEAYAEEYPPDLWEDLEVVYRNCRHLSSMVDDVLDLSQAEVGRLVLRPDWVDLADIVEAVVVAVRPMAEKKHLHLQVSVPEDLPPVYCDQVRVRQVLLNLVTNAARFTVRGGIEVEVRERGASIEVKVADTGPGIPSEDVDRVFEPFYQGVMGDSYAGKGSGLGLSISRQLVQLHGGRMWLESGVGTGACFYFALPTSTDGRRVERPDRWIKEDWIWHEHAFETGGAHSAEQLLRSRILVCDQAGSLCSELTAYGDAVELVSVPDLAAARDVLSQCPAHALILNAAAPQDLPALVEGVRRQHPHTPVIGCSVPRPVTHAAELGALGHLVKPVTQAELEEAIGQVGGAIRRVLVVDDDPEVLQLWTRMLQIHDRALEVVTAANGQQALEEIAANRPDLVLLDVVMPGMDGWQVLERLERNNGATEIPVIVISAHDPADQPAVSDLLVATVGEGLSPSTLLRCALSLSSLLLRSDRQAEQVPL